MTTKEALIFASGTLFGMVLLTAVSAIAIHIATKREGANANED